MSTLRVVLDTIVLVSGLAYPGSVPGRIVSAWRRGAVDLVLSRYILDELARVLPRLSRRLQWSSADLQDFIDSLALLADMVEPDSGAEMPRDRADHAILGTLLAARADYLITGDKDLLVLADRHAILTPAEFWARHGD